MELQSRPVKPAQAIVIILVFGALLAGWLVARGNMLATPMPTHMTVLPEGNVAVAFEQQLFTVHADGRIDPGIELPKLSRSTGLTAYGADSVLVYLGGNQDAGLGSTMRKWRRKKPVPRTPGAEEGLYACPLAGGACQLFSHQFQTSGSARLLWDDSRQQLFVADTAQHVLKVLDAHGALIKTLDDFKFPNGLWQHGKQLLIADTNHHRIAAIALDTLSEPTTVLKVYPDSRHTWPTDIVQVGSQYWVLSSNRKLEDSQLYRYDADWNLLGQGSLDLDDLISMAPLGDGALVVDMATHSLWRLDAQGQTVQDILLPGMPEAHQHWQTWHRVSQAMITIFVLALIAGFAYAIVDARKSKTMPRAMARQTRFTPKQALHAPAFQIWIKPHRVQAKLIATWLVACIFVLAQAWLFWILSHATAPGTSALIGSWGMFTLAVMLLLVAVGWRFNHARKSRLGVEGDQLVLQAPDGRLASGKGARIGYSMNMLVIDDVIVPAQRPNRRSTDHYRLWNPQQMREHVNPLLQDARSLGIGESAALVWRLRYWPTLCMYTSIILFVLAIAGYGLLNLPQ